MDYSNEAGRIGATIDENDSEKMKESREGSLVAGAGEVIGELGLFPKRYVIECYPTVPVFGYVRQIQPFHFSVSCLNKERYME